MIIEVHPWKLDVDIEGTKNLKRLSNLSKISQMITGREGHKTQS